MEKPQAATPPMLGICSIAATVFGVFMVKYGPASLGTALFVIVLPLAGFVFAIASLIARERPRYFGIVATLVNIASFLAIWLRG
jgi:hypothetical protein